MMGFLQVILIIIILFVLFLIYGFFLQNFPVTEEYEIFSDKITKEINIVSLADLHACNHGKKNEKLLSMIANCKPDIVCIAGDMTVKNSKNTDRVLEFLKELGKKYLVFYGMGNHEIRMKDLNDYLEQAKNYNINILRNQSVINDQIEVIGLDLDEDWYHKFWDKRNYKYEDLKRFLPESLNKKYKILLAHNPEYFDLYCQSKADLILSGHIHGGIMQLPFLGGVISPSLRLFPKYDSGLFLLENNQGKKISKRTRLNNKIENKQCMIISRGLGLHHIKLRFFNKPELVHIRLRPRNKMEDIENGDPRKTRGI